MPTRVLVQRRNWFRLPVSVPALFTAREGKRNLAGNILDISVNGIGFTVDENLIGHSDITTSFWLPFDLCRPNEAMLEPIAVRLAIVASRYAAAFETYAYGAVFVGLKPDIRKEIEFYLARASAAPAG